jgi:formylglycine-generating enzyme required for sulfatase activity
MIRSLFVVSLVLLGGLATQAQSVISNVKSWQEPGTHIIKITYDVTVGNRCTTALQASLDGGVNYGLVIPAEAIVTGSHIGPGISGSGRVIKLDASKVSALDDTFTKNLRFKVVANGIITPRGEMVPIPGGTFQMGDAFSEGNSREQPVHSVTVSAFYLQNTEVTNDQMVQVLNWAYGQGNLVATTATVKNAAGNQQELMNLDSSYCRILWNDTLNRFEMKAGKGSNYPCVEVTWYGSAAWCNYRSEMEGLTPCYSFADWTCNWNANGYRLPSEAEWERAARGGQNGRRFPWGDTITHSLANYYSSVSYAYDVSPTRGYHPTYYNGVSPYTSPVGSFAPNIYGLYDMAGNVWEWCWDRYSASYYSSSPSIDPRGPASGTDRVGRGGSWNYGSYAYGCRIANRYNDTPDYSYYHVGFRPARSSVP